MVLKKILKLLACSRDKEVEFNAAKWYAALDGVTRQIDELRPQREEEMERLTVQIVNFLRNGESEEECALATAGYLIQERLAGEANDLIMRYCQNIRRDFERIRMQRICPDNRIPDFQSLSFAAPRCLDITALTDFKKIFEKYFGREFVAASKKLQRVDEELFGKVSLEPPSLEAKLRELSEIASSNNINWRYSRAH